MGEESVVGKFMAAVFGLVTAWMLPWWLALVLAAVAAMGWLVVAVIGVLE